MVEPATPSAAPPGTPTTDPMASIRALDRPTQLVVGAGVATAVVAIVGAVVEAWAMEPTALVLVVVGLLAAVIAWADASGKLPSDMPIHGSDLIAGSAAIAAVIGVLSLVERLTDLDQEGRRGEILGLLLIALLLVVGIGLAIVAEQRGAPVRSGWGATWMSGLPAKLVLGGAVLLLIGWLINVTYGVFNLSPAIIPVSMVIAAAFLFRAGASWGSEGRVPLVAAVVAAALATLVALGHWSPFAAEELPIGDWIGFLAYVVGAVLALVGTAWGAAIALGLVADRAAGPTS